MNTFWSILSFVMNSLFMNLNYVSTIDVYVYSFIIHMNKYKTAVFACKEYFLYCTWCKYKNYEVSFLKVCV